MFSLNELIKATKGKLIRGRKSGRFSGICIDSRIIKPNEVFIAVKGENFDGHDFIKEAIKKRAGCVILARSSPLIAHKSIPVIQVKDTIKALGDIARFHRCKFNIPIIAVSGSNGKTTTKEMIACVLEKKFKVLKNEGTKNNHIGVPQTLLRLDTSHKAAVLELGTNHFGEIGYLADIARPSIGVITNIGPGHLEYFATLTGVFKEKSFLLKRLSAPSIAILNSDDNLLRKKLSLKNSLSIGINNNADFKAGNIKNNCARTGFTVNQKCKFNLNTPGDFFVYNALFAVAIGRLLGMEYNDISRALADFKFPSNRLNIMEVNNITFINDSYNSNPLSLKYAMRVLEDFETPGRRILVMGDMLELGKSGIGFHRAAGKDAAAACDIFLCVGRLARLAANSAKECGFSAKNIFTCNNSTQAREILLRKISPAKKDVVLVKGSRGMKMEEVFKI